MGFKSREAKKAVYALSEHASPEADLTTLLRAALQFLAP
jgi:Holliday junction resolvasome RuvABC DNA-binding subunit